MNELIKASIVSCRKVVSQGQLEGSTVNKTLPLIIKIFQLSRFPNMLLT